METTGKKLFNRNFTLVLIGQIISLFGNQIIRYALPLYLLTETGSAALYGMVLALSFIPMIFMAPVGGIIADRVNKRNVMVCLDFATAVLVLVYSQIRGYFSLVPLLVAVLMILFGIQGAYSPTVQSALPFLVEQKDLMKGNAMINSVNSISGIIGPVLGGMMFAMVGLQPILIVGFICFLFSAVMELFIHLPFEKPENGGNIFKIAKEDMKDSFTFISKERSEIGKVVWIAAAINLIISSLIIVGFPVVINQHLGFTKEFASGLQGVAEGSMALGGLLGAMFAGAFSKKLDLKKVGNWMLASALTLIPMGVILCISLKGMAAFVPLAVAAFLMMMTSTVMNIELLTYVQLVTRPNMIGKVMSLIMCLCMCASPLGQFIYGILFEKLSGFIGVIFLVVSVLGFLLSVISNRIFRHVENIPMPQEGDYMPVEE